MPQKAIGMRISGFVTSLILTLLTYFIIVYPAHFHLSTQAAVVTIFNLALLQFIAQFIFFLDLWREDGPPWNVGIFLSTVSIIFIIIFFSIWIMNHLNENMMPMSP